MAASVVDTHAIVWYLTGDSRLSQAALLCLDGATANGDPIFVPAICLVELLYLVEKGRVPERARQLLIRALDDPEKPALLVPIDRPVLDAVERISREEISDMPDRIVAATALSLGLPLISRDSQIRSSSVETIW